MLALALLTPQPLLLMDEPFDGFDLTQTREIMGVLRKTAGRGRALVLAIHQLIDAERICDRFVLLSDGRTRGVGTLDELRTQSGKNSAGLELTSSLRSPDGAAAADPGSAFQRAPKISLQLFAIGRNRPKHQNSGRLF